MHSELLLVGIAVLAAALHGADGLHPTNRYLKRSTSSAMRATVEASAPPSEDTMTKLTAQPPFATVVVNKALEALDEALPKEKVQPNGAPEYLGGPPSKERVVVLGSGWGAHAFIDGLDADKYDCTVVSPRNFFLFTPMLAGAAVGTVEYRSISQPIRSVNPGVGYLEATCTHIDAAAKTIECELVVCDGAACEIRDFSLSFDHLIVAVGATTNTFGIPGVQEHCFFLKQVEDAAKVRRGIGNCFERASVPGLTDAQREAILTFAVIGAGPTGVEFVGELCDFIEQDVPRFYPSLLPYVRVKLIEASDKVLMAFDSELQASALETLRSRVSVSPSRGSDKPLVEVLLSAGVKEVKPDEILLSDGVTVPYGLAVWAAGIGPLPLVKDLAQSIPEQASLDGRGKLVVDNWLRVCGAPGVWALGDCVTIDQKPLPATAQVASQQGAFLARLFTRNYDLSGAAPKIVGAKQGLVQQFGDADGYAKGFNFLNLGILAYLGDSKALAQVNVDESVVKGTGAAGFALWRSVYLSKQVSWRNRALVAIDWAKIRLFGRDMTRL
jgi:NADH dehydrogenase FAD-containing subunit